MNIFKFGQGYNLYLNYKWLPPKARKKKAYYALIQK
jgi:hypothetical protein